MDSSLIQKLCACWELGAPLLPPRPVSGGLLHTMWHLKTSSGEFAIKELNPEILNRGAAVRQSYSRSEEIARLFALHGIPAVTSLKHQSDTLCEIAGNTFLIYPWMHGAILPQERVTSSQVAQIASIVADIHALKLEFADLEVDAYNLPSIKEFNHFADKAFQARLSFADALYSLLPQIDLWLKNLERALPVLNRTLVVSHRDLDPKNVLWLSSSQPLLIDWESAGTIHPALEFMTLLLDWCGATKGAINFHLLKAMVKAYTCKQELDLSLLPDLFHGIQGNWLRWLLFNMQRCLQEEASKDLALQQVDQTIETLIYIDRKQEEVIALLHSMSL